MAPIAKISSSVPDTARTKLAASDTEPRREDPTLVLAELATDHVRAREEGHAKEPVRAMEAVRLINGPSGMWVGADVCRRKLGAVWEGKKSPAEFVREKEVVMLQRLAIPWGDAIAASAVL